MSYTADLTRLNGDVSLHANANKSSNDYTFSTPAYLGAGVTRPSSTEFTLAAGRSYVLISGICQYHATTFNWNYWEEVFQWHDGTSYIGLRGSSRIGRSGQGAVLRQVQYRSEAVVFIPSSSITTSVTVSLKEVSKTSDGSTGFLYTPQGSITGPSCVIISVPD